jgi:hypothetical protein
MKMRRHSVITTLSSPQYSFCERSTATATSPWHIRRVGEEGIKLGGGAPDTALCSAELRKGWDVQREVTAQAVILLSKVDESGRRGLCENCAGCYLAECAPSAAQDPDSR